MWVAILHVNSVLLALSGVYFIYSLGSAIINWSWKQFWIALVIFAFFWVAEVVLAAIAEP